MLFFLNSENKWHRLLRRGLVMGVFAFVAIVLEETLHWADTPVYLIPLITALLAMVDKARRLG